MDEADLANDRAEQFVSDALRALKSRAEPVQSSGICQSCHDAIEPERLQANPAARLCRDCATEDEAARQRARRLGAA